MVLRYHHLPNTKCYSGLRKSEYQRHPCSRLATEQLTNSNPNIVPLQIGSKMVGLGGIWSLAKSGSLFGFLGTFDNSVHKLVHSEAKPHKCSVCSQTFSLQGNMRRHIETLHSEDRPFGCHNCNDTFKLKENLKSHVRRIHLKHKKFNCKDCQAIFGTNAELLCHIKRIHTLHVLSYPCDECGKMFRFESDVKTHQKRHQGIKIHICKICQKAFHSAMELKGHQRIHTDKRLHNCLICKAAFKTKVELKNHQTVHTHIKNFKCNMCPLSFKRREALQRHRKIEVAKKTGKKSVECEFCNKFYWTREELVDHIRIYHKADGPHMCPHCKKILTTKISLRGHILKHDMWNKREDTRKIKEEEETIEFALKAEPNSCFKCKKSFQNLKILKKHLLCHYKNNLSMENKESDKNGLRCDQCPKIFSSKGFLKNHLFYHTKPKTLSKCNMCDKTYHKEQSLEQHIKWHKGQKDYQCSECNKLFSQSGNLKSHIQSIHRTERPFKCSLCDQSFKQTDGLKRHSKIHSGWVKKFECDLCFKAFARPSQLKTHLVIHSDKRAFKCDFDGCDKTFNLRQSLRGHKITHSGLKPFQCETCKLNFSAKKSLRNHIQGIHKKEKSHSCLKCDKSFF